MEHSQNCTSNDQALRHRQLNRYHISLSDEEQVKIINGSAERLSGSKHHRRRRRRENPTRQVTQRGTQVFLPRMILRNMPFKQSNNQCQVVNKYTSKSSLNKLLLSDWFHVLLRIKMHYSICALLSLWLGMILFFAFVYVRIDLFYDGNCGLGIPPASISFPAAFAFSLETCTTVGYGLPGKSNAFFESNCLGLQSTVFFQMTWSMLFNAFLFAFFYSQLSKSERRSLQLVFSDKLCINVSRDGKVCASVQCYDIDSAFPVVEAHARMYLLDHKLQLNPLRLTHPDDNLGGMLYPSIPQKIIHHIDYHSALAPTHPMPLLSSPRTNSGIQLRSFDHEEIICPVCGDKFGTYERLASHARFNKMIEKQEGYPIEDSHQAFEMPETSPLTLQEVTDHIEKTMSEIMVVVEAIDPQLSGTFQANQSYKYQDIVFGADHESCTSITPDNKILVDMKTFHKIRTTDEASSFSSSSENDNKGSFLLNTSPHTNHKRTTVVQHAENSKFEGHIPVCIEATTIEEEKKVERERSIVKNLDV